jgi:hypothetical protein
VVVAASDDHSSPDLDCSITTGCLSLGDIIDDGLPCPDLEGARGAVQHVEQYCVRRKLSDEHNAYGSASVTLRVYGYSIGTQTSCCYWCCIGVVRKLRPRT